MYRLASSGLITPPCGVPCRLPLPPVMRRVPSASRSSTGALSHSLISRSTCRSTMRRATDCISSLMRDRVEVLRQIGVHHIGVASAEQRVHRLDRVGPAPSRPIAIGRRVEIRLEDRLQHQLGGGLHHPVPDRRDAERPLAAAGLRDHHPSHRCWPIRPCSQVLPEAGEPLLQPCRLDRPKRRLRPRPARPRWPGQRIGVSQNVLAADLVVEQVEAERRLRLRLADTASSEGSGSSRVLPGSSPITGPRLRRKHTRSQGPSLRRRYPASSVLWPCPTPASTAARARRWGRDPRPNGPPPITRITFPACRAHYPGGSRRVLMSVASPSRAAFPESQAGRHPHRHFRGLLRLHSRYGPLDRSTAQGGLCHEASARPVTRPSRSSATRPNRQLSGWILPPLVNRAVGAH